MFQRSAMPHLCVRSDVHYEDGGSTFFSNAVYSISEYHRSTVLDPFKRLVPPTRVCNLEDQNMNLDAMMIKTFR
jgi:hypothetical protein